KPLLHQFPRRRGIVLWQRGQLAHVRAGEPDPVLAALQDEPHDLGPVAELPANFGQLRPDLAGECIGLAAPAVQRNARDGIVADGEMNGPGRRCTHSDTASRTETITLILTGCHPRGQLSIILINGSLELSAQVLSSLSRL